MEKPSRDGLLFLLENTQIIDDGGHLRIGIPEDVFDDAHLAYIRRRIREDLAWVVGRPVDAESMSAITTTVAKILTDVFCGRSEHRQRREVE